MAEPGFTLFDTTLGRCGVAWTELGIASVEFPQRDDAATRQRLQRTAPGAREQPPPPDVQHAVGRIVALLAGEPADLSPIVLDTTDVSPFHREVYAVARTIPPGATVTYGEISRRLGDPTASRAVGQALGRNPFPIVVPCHRVVAAGGRLGGFSARGGTETKLRLLEIERRHAEAGLTLFD